MTRANSRGALIIGLRDCSPKVALGSRGGGGGREFRRNIERVSRSIRRHGTVVSIDGQDTIRHESCGLGYQN